MRIYIVEDDPVYARYLKHNVELNPEFEAVVFESGGEILKNLDPTPDVVTLDYSLADMKCEELIERIKKSRPEVSLIVISAQEDISTAVKLLRAGIYDYIVKNEETRERLWNTLRHLKENLGLKEELEHLRQEIVTHYDFESIIKGHSTAIKKVFKLMEKATKTNITVSVTGETGTGKELVAKAIHYNSKFRKKPLVSVNMAAIPHELIESELFGYEKGAFTGAQSRRIGKFEEANGGTVFLDEIAEMDLNLQAKLLRVLQEKEVTRIGGNHTIKLDVRVIVATHRDLAHEVKRGNFREDLYYRILGLPIELPPLRERENDIVILARYFADVFCKENGINRMSFTKEAQSKMMNYHWPGNVRELKAVIELATVMSSDQLIREEDLVFKSTRDSPDFMFQDTTLKQYTENLIRYYLKKNDNNIMVVAKKLDIGKSTIYRMIKEGRIEIN